MVFFKKVKLIYVQSNGSCVFSKIIKKPNYYFYIVNLKKKYF